MSNKSLDWQVSSPTTKLFRGAYNYFEKNNIYSEENFEVFRDNKLYNLTFVSNMISRTATGELFKINVEFVVSKSWVPQLVRVNKSLGHNNVTELWELDDKTNTIIYKFIDHNTKKEAEFRNATTPKFHIATPTAASSMVFVMSKRFDETGKSDYSTFCSNNQWRPQGGPVNKNIRLQKLSVTTETLILNKQELRAMHYHLYESGESLDDNLTNQTPLNIYISQHVGIPYLIEGIDNTKIQIKYLNNLED